MFMGGGETAEQAFHFTDLRRGVLIEDSHASGFGDDFFVSFKQNNFVTTFGS